MTARNRSVQLQNLLPLNLFDNPAYEASGISFFPLFTLEQCVPRFKGLARLGETVDSDATELAYELDDSR